VLLGWARSQATAHDPEWHALATLPQRWTAPVFPLKAADFIKRGMTPGPALGAALHEAEEAWIAADFPAGSDAIAAIAAAAAAEVRPM
jgi:poly(A) polymerase